MRVFFSITYLCMCGAALSQADTSAIKQLKEVEIARSANTYNNETALNVSTLSLQKMRQNGAFNISDGLSTVPGISQINTGVAISKPVIRGLYGNRILTVFSGLRFDNQQWQDEHGLGISEIGTDRVEIIKGPASLLYGSEAVGGVINIIEEKAPEDGRIVGDLNTKFLSNTYGNATDLGFKGNRNNKNWRIRAGYESNADYSAGKMHGIDSNRVLNSRFDGYYLKASFGFKKKNWICQNNFNNSLNDYGFIMADNRDVKPVDDRFSRVMDGPHHTVVLNILSSENLIRLKDALLKLNLGAQSNIRLEDEGGGDVSLNMHLSSLVYNLQWIKIIHKTELIIGSQGILQKNTNYGKRKIVPDANLSETGLSVFLNQPLGKYIILEGGVGGNYKHIETIETDGVNNPGNLIAVDTTILPFSKEFPSLNGMLGFTFNPGKHLNLKLCGSTGFRSANLAEFSSNGLHEGIYQYEVGDPNLKAEQNLNVEASVNFISKHFHLSVAAFNNTFSNYIYLQPTTELFNGIQVFRYMQNDATLYGGEAAVSIKPVKALELNCSYSTVTGALYDGTYLPFIPADKIHSEVKYTIETEKKLKAFYVLVGNDYISKQIHPSANETTTGDYTLFNAGLGTLIQMKHETLSVSVTCNNLTDRVYYDHLSRFKAYEIHNIGRNIILNLSIPFNIK